MVVGLHSAKDPPGNSGEGGGTDEAGHLFIAPGPKYPSDCSPQPRSAGIKETLETQVQRAPNQLDSLSSSSRSAIQRDPESP